MKKPDVDYFSLGSLLLTPVVNGKTVPAVELDGQKIDASATGFVYAVNKDFVLVTNWHVVTGINPLTNMLILPARPEALNIWMHKKDSMGFWINTTIDLYQTDAKGVKRSLWYEHPVHGQNVDVAVIPLTMHPELEFYPVNATRPGVVTDMKSVVGEDVFVVGFPLGRVAGGVFPIWKRASFASEPEIDADKNYLPKFLIDTASREGMSGSPVFQRGIGGYLTEDGGQRMGPGVFTKFLGVYSGRIGAHDAKAQLGIVWKRSLIDEIINNGKAGNSP